MQGGAARGGAPVRPGALLRHELRDGALDGRRADRFEAASAMRGVRGSGGRRARRIEGETMKTQWQILVVDDEEVMRESLAAWLAEDGYGVDTAASGTRGDRPRAAEGLRDLLHRPQDAGRHRRHRDDDGDPAAARRRVDHHHHGLRDGGHGDHGDEGGRAGLHRQAVQPGGDLAAGEPHHQGEEPAAREHDPAQEALAAVPLRRYRQQERADAGDLRAGSRTSPACAARC